MWSVIESINQSIEGAGFEFQETSIENITEGTKLYKIVNTNITNSELSNIGNAYTYDFNYSIGIVQGSDNTLDKEEKLDEVYNEIGKIILDSIGSNGELFMKTPGTGFKNYTTAKGYNCTALLSFLITYKYR